MAHYVAELIVRAESVPATMRIEARRDCAQAILDLWAQAKVFPAKSAVFHSVDRVIEAVESLHPDASPYYRNNLWRALDERAGEGGGEVEGLLQIAFGIDGAARNLIHHVLAHASRAAGRESAEWLELAQQIEDDDALTELRIRLVRSGRDEAELRNHRIEQLEKRIGQLEFFIVTANELKANLDRALEAVRGASNVSSAK